MTRGDRIQAVQVEKSLAFPKVSKVNQHHLSPRETLAMDMKLLDNCFAQKLGRELGISPQGFTGLPYNIAAFGAHGPPFLNYPIHPGAMHPHSLMRAQAASGQFSIDGVIGGKRTSFEGHHNLESTSPGGYSSDKQGDDPMCELIFGVLLLFLIDYFILFYV